MESIGNKLKTPDSSLSKLEHFATKLWTFYFATKVSLAVDMLFCDKTLPCGRPLILQ
jgi:hypothetical protein